MSHFKCSVWGSAVLKLYNLFFVKLYNLETNKYYRTLVSFSSQSFKRWASPFPKEKEKLRKFLVLHSIIQRTRTAPERFDFKIFSGLLLSYMYDNWYVKILMNVMNIGHKI